MRNAISHPKAEVLYNEEIKKNLSNPQAGFLRIMFFLGLSIIFILKN